MPVHLTCTEQELLQQLQAGSEHAFTTIYQQYWERVYAIAWYFSRQKEAAEEVVQQVFMSLWERRDQLDIKSSLEGYLATAAKYCTLDARRKQQRRNTLLHQAPVQEQHVNIDEELQAKILQEYLHGIIEQLPEKTRIIYQYSSQTDLSIADISGMMGISPKTVESHITRARKTLRGALQQLSNWIFSLCFLLTLY